MTKGIRDFTNEAFMSNIAILGETGDGTAFRKAVMGAVVLQFGITVASAATHYNYSLKQAKIECPELVKGLGREVGKTGGRKATHLVDVIKVKTGEVVMSGVSKGAATLLISKAAAQGKAKLAIKTDAPVVAEVAATTEAPAAVAVAEVAEVATA